ncbi:hypothetical protein QWZ10_05580 [Paracoccus cavernae]|uniref:Uncharacterized protein n=1 Tax=Paracoccus cavernae TaxID=1571207 RepID=A0ABT8D854_9RHOB|nr:hypothetical protein [Paracoccus cavernae]
MVNPGSAPAFDPVPRFAELEQIPNCDSTERVAPAAYDLWLTQRLQGLQGSHWLDQFDFQAATEICDLLGRTLVRAAFPQLRDMSPADRHAAICRAFNILTEAVMDGDLLPPAILQRKAVV